MSYYRYLYVPDSVTSEFVRPGGKDYLSKKRLNYWRNDTSYPRPYGFSLKYRF